MTPTPDLMCNVQIFQRTMKEIDAWCPKKGELWSEEDEKSGLAYRREAADFARDGASRRLCEIEVYEYFSALGKGEESRGQYEAAIKRLRISDAVGAMARRILDEVQSGEYLPGRALAPYGIFSDDE